MRQRALIAGLVTLACSSQRPATTSAPVATASPPAPAVAGGGDSIRLAAFRIPRQVAEFRLTRRRDFDNPIDGSVVRFVGPRPLAADVYIYPILPTSLATSDAGRDSAATLEFRRSREGIYQFQAQNGHPEPTALGETEVSAPAGSDRIIRGHRGTYRYQRGGEALTSHLYVFGLRDRYVKVRVSYLEAEGPADPPTALEQFVRALVGAIAAGYEPEGER